MTRPAKRGERLQFQFGFERRDRTTFRNTGQQPHPRKAQPGDLRIGTSRTKVGEDCGSRRPKGPQSHKANRPATGGKEV